eukprot:TRINITY_DN28353_c0_g1_i1.p1 TRINITY_DN28353_c0_g1~~TRINITY_DN28353_c0_g1_i1.p1  ORF type:complete len:389 (-),score=76.77 TRINITY_DN28353_c0_g1_i1:77-1243(-)
MIANVVVLFTIFAIRTQGLSSCPYATVNLTHVQSLLPPENHIFFGSEVYVSGRHLLILGGNVNNSLTAFFYRYNADQLQWVPNSVLLASVDTPSGTGRGHLRGNRALIGSKVAVYLELADQWVFTVDLNATTTAPGALPGWSVLQYGLLGKDNRAFMVALSGPGFTVMSEDNEVWSAEGQFPLPLAAQLQYALAYDEAYDMVFTSGLVFKGNYNKSPQFVYAASFANGSSPVEYMIHNPDHAEIWQFPSRMVAANGTLAAIYYANVAGNSGLKMYSFNTSGDETWELTFNTTTGQGYPGNVAYSHARDLVLVSVGDTSALPTFGVNFYKPGDPESLFFCIDTPDNNLGDSMAFAGDNDEFVILSSPFEGQNFPNGKSGAVHIFKTPEL